MTVFNSLNVIYYKSAQLFFILQYINILGSWLNNLYLIFLL